MFRYILFIFISFCCFKSSLMQFYSKRNEFSYEVEHDANQIFVLYVLMYMAVSACFAFRSNEFISFGLTTENLFSSILGQESGDFIQYHMKKIILTLLIQTYIPYGFIIGLHILKIYGNFVNFVGPTIATFYTYITLTLLLGNILLSAYWYLGEWKNHPVVQNLLRFSDAGDWKTVASDISNEFKRVDKLIIQCGSRNTLAITQNWIIKVGMYKINFAHQSNTELTIHKQNTYNIGGSVQNRQSFQAAVNSFDVSQYLDIRVSCRRNESPFFIRINSLDLNNLNEALRYQIVIPSHISILRTTIDRFLEHFREIVKSNQDPENCMGCFAVRANVKLKKCCPEGMDETLDGIIIPKCMSCGCKPLWCIDCMGKWFASRQDQQNVGNWLSSKCSCPVCRATFCMLDVCPVEYSIDS